MELTIRTSKLMDAMKVAKPIWNPSIGRFGCGNEFALSLPAENFSNANKHIKLLSPYIYVQIKHPLMKFLWLFCDGRHTVDEIFQSLVAKIPGSKLSVETVERALLMLEQKRLIKIYG